MRGSKWLGVELVQVSLQEKLISAMGSGCAIYMVFYLTNLLLPSMATAGVVASMGASAVLLYAIPHGPLSQPWPLVAGHSLSACIGVTCCQWIQHPAMAAAFAVGISIGVMYQFGCIHPPGGATAFTAVMGGEAIQELGYMYVLCPILSNVCLMLLLAVLINAPFRWRRYPAGLFPTFRAAAEEGNESKRPTHAEVLASIRSLDAFVDVSEDDLIHFVRELGIAEPDRADQESDSVHKVTLRAREDRSLELKDHSEADRQRFPNR
jgi:CBS-domain-containing membrane protein